LGMTRIVGEVNSFCQAEAGIQDRTVTGVQTCALPIFSQPFRTIQKAADTAQSGDQAFIRGGTYRETVTVRNSGASAAPIRFQARSEERRVGKQGRPRRWPQPPSEPDAYNS